MTTPYNPLPNQFRKDLIDKKPLIGCWSTMTSHISAEILGQAGFDWLLIDGEHSANDLQTFVTQLMALKDSPSAPIVRPQWAEPVIIKRLLDIGFFNFLFPFIGTAEEARQVVAATRYPPEGIRGVSMMHRGNRYGYETDYHATVNDNLAVIVQIESVEGLNNAEAIGRVEGVDCLFIGPSDLSVALGHFNNPLHPEVQEAIQKILKAGQATGTAVGILAHVEEHAHRYLEMGLNFVSVGADAAIMKTGSLELRKRFKS
jgi:2-dehydro-3-deoxyglucarate aldolase